jgi:hypothetical protein
VEYERNVTASGGYTEMSNPPGNRKKRRRGDVEAAINAYMKLNPSAQYFEMLNDLHAKGYRVNRHGNIGLMSLWLKACEEARR